MGGDGTEDGRGVRWEGMAQRMAGGVRWKEMVRRRAGE